MDWKNQVTTNFKTLSFLRPYSFLLSSSRLPFVKKEMGSSVNRISLNGGHQLQTLLMSIIVFSSELIRDNFARYFRVVIIALQDRD